MSDIDEEKLRRTLGEDAVRDVRKLKEVERALERAGLVQRNQGRLEVTPRGARKMGERALVRVFETLKRDREGVHASAHLGGAAEPTGSTRPLAGEWRWPCLPSPRGLCRRSQAEPVPEQRLLLCEWS